MLIRQLASAIDPPSGMLGTAGADMTLFNVELEDIRCVLIRGTAIAPLGEVNPCPSEMEIASAPSAAR